jgi:hypothetical protein
MADEKLEEILREWHSQQEKGATALERNAKKEKHSWDKFAALSTFLSTVVIAAIGDIFTHTCNAQQSERNEALKQQEIRIARIRIVEKFVPRLTGSEEQKKIAIFAINPLSNTKIAAQLAILYPNEGTISALKAIAKSGDESERHLANQAPRSSSIVSAIL